MKAIITFLLSVLLLAAPSASFAVAYKYKIGSKFGLQAACRDNGASKDTQLKLYLPANPAQAGSDSIRIKLHLCVAGSLIRSNFPMQLPLKKWSQTGSGSFQIPAKIMKREFGINQAAPVSVRVVDQNEIRGVSGFIVGKHYPLKSVTISIPGRGSISATLNRIQPD
ncbi:MAG TPA: hypothetical protein PKC28_04830 [Bdellovibrionales bacterium]|nr:hypothetical protein [Bdellovibrionales bacterium]